ncbi:hypothetical protein JTB14_021379 [Gonioctena quinquepunctata]|nr:hypothetical protein JTB14_021379 [Gonioctena quinquepunctata]
MKIAHINIRSILTGFDDFARIVTEGDFDIVAVTETSLSDDEDTGAIRIPGYNFYNKPRVTRGGGICVYYRNSHSNGVVSCHYDQK